MSAIPPMIVELQLKADGIKAQLNQAEAQLKQFGNTAKTQADGVGKLQSGIKGLAGAFVGFLAVGKAVDLLKQSAKAQVEDTKSKALLQRQLIATTGATVEQVDAVEKSIKAMETMSQVADDNIRPAMALLTRSTKDAAIATNLTTVALDVSAGTGKDVQTVAVALSKAYAGNTGALARLGINVKGMKNPLQEVTKQFKGAAAVAAETDPYKKMTLAMDNIHEAIGTAVLPLLVKFASWLQGVVPQIEAFFKALSDPTTKMGAQFKAVTDIALGLFGTIVTNLPTILALAGGIAAGAVAFKVLSGAMAVYSGAMAIARIATTGFTLALASTGIGAIVVAVGLLTAGIISLNMAAGSGGSNYYKVPGNIANAASKAQKAAYDKAIKANVHDRGETVEGRAKALGQQAYENVINTYAQGQSQFAKVAADAKAKADAAQQKALEDLLAGGSKTPKTPKAGDTKLTDYLKATQTAIFDARKTYTDAVGKANDDYKNKTLDQVASFKDAFAQATAVNLSDLWDNSDKSAKGLVDKLKAQLTSVKEFASDIAGLAAAGFSKDFIQQVESMGPQSGDAMAKALLGSDAGTKQSVMDLFNEAQAVSTTGVDNVVSSIANQFLTSTQALTTALQDAADALNTSLSAIDSSFSGKVSSLGGSKKSMAVKQVKSVLGSAQALVGTNINTTVNVTTNATAEAIANATVSSIKFNSPALIGS